MDRNIENFQKMEKELVLKHHGKYVIFHNGKLVAIHKNLNIAIMKAEKKTGARDFFVHPLYTIEETSNILPTLE